METAAFQTLQPYCEADEITVGTSIHVEHRAATGIGTRITAEAVVDSFDGRFYTVRVSASDGTQEIGRGTVGRAVVSVSKFAARMRNRGESCVPSCEYRVASKRTNGQFMGWEQSAELSLGEHS